MSELRAKLNQLDSQNLQNNDTLYSALEEIIDKIEYLEGNQREKALKMRRHDADYYKEMTYFSQAGIAAFTYDELTRFIKRIIEDKP